MSTIVNAAFLGVIGVAGLYATRGLFAKQRLIAAWPTVEGRLLSKEASPSPHGSSRYYLTVRYTYDVDGITHESTQFGPLAVHSRLKRVIDKDVAALPNFVTVFYNPANPDEAYLSLGPRFWPKVAQVACGCFVVIAGLMLLM
jgi:hypothetical protein